MAKHSHYSPALSRFMVCVLYHEARIRKVPMTQLVDALLTQALIGSEAWKTAESQKPDIHDPKALLAA